MNKTLNNKVRIRTSPKASSPKARAIHRTRNLKANNPKVTRKNLLRDPVDDIPQPQPGEESEDLNEGEQEQANMPEPSEGEGSEGASEAALAEPIEGMTEAEAAALLDSLRSKETLLPFIDQQRSGRNRDTRDW